MNGTLESRAAAGDVQAQIALALALEGGPRNDLARGWFARAAQSGDAAALRLLARNLLARPPLDIPQGIGMIRTAAARGDGEAAHLCAVLAGQDTQLAGNWTMALDYLTRAAALGSDLARRQVEILSDGAGRIDAQRWLAPCALDAVSDAPRIATVRGFASQAECDWLIERARPLLKAAEVYNPGGGGGLRAEEVRSNSAASFAMTESDVVLTLMRARIAAATGLASDDMEPPSVLHYAAGEQFAQHYDFIDPENPQLAADLARHGQRWATFLVYLSDDFDGGETDFPELRYRYRGRKGDAILFWNVTPDGRPDAKTLHAGLAPTRGEKWLFSQWLRKR